MKKVFVIGSINQDLVIHTKQFPREGETVLGHDFFMNAGGKGANQAVASAKQGANTYLFGAVGSDVFGEQMLASLKDYKVDCAHIYKKQGASGTAMVMLHEEDNRIIVSPGANFLYTLEEAKRDLDNLANPGDIVVFQMEIKREIVETLIHYAKEKDLFVIFNPAPMCKDLNPNIIQDVDLLIMNEWEAKSITNTEDKIFNSSHIIERLVTLGAKSVILTLGKDGGLYYEKGQVIEYAAYETDAVDTTGAGDSFVGALAASLANGQSIQEALKRASYVAGVTVSRPGAQQAIPWKEEIDLILSK